MSSTPPSAYPLTPGFQNTDTSREAAELNAEQKAAIRLRCLVAVRSAPQHDTGVLLKGVAPDPKTTPQRNSRGQPVGITSREAAAALGQHPDNVHPRFSELRAAGQIRDSGVRRLNAHSGRRAIAWVAGDDPDKASGPGDNAPPKARTARQHYIRGMAAAYYLGRNHGVEALIDRLAELEPNNPEWQY